ncbi:MAG TPA: GNAT family N-acetyltransferase [Casimicrobium sp.]|mgnify:CR=1 FL=1|nr:GNAT family N-acetyltransferase [Casimicrobium sp.]
MKFGEIRELDLGDCSEVKEFLKKNRASSMFLLSNLATSGIVDGDQPFQGAYAGAFEEGSLCGVLAHYWNGNLMPQAPVAHLPELLRVVLTASSRPVKGMVGLLSQCEVLISSLGIPADGFQLFERERLYRLTADSLAIPRGAGRVRRARPEDVEALVSLYAAYNVEALNESADEALASASRDIERRLSSATQWVLPDEVTGAIVSACAFNATSMPAVQIGGVYTPPALRGKGYAQACVAGALMQAFNDGFSEAVLFTGNENVPAWRAYEAIGFRAIDEFCVALLAQPWRADS